MEGKQMILEEQIIEYGVLCRTRGVLCIPLLSVLLCFFLFLEFASPERGATPDILGRHLQQSASRPALYYGVPNPFGILYGLDNVADPCVGACLEYRGPEHGGEAPIATGSHGPPNHLLVVGLMEAQGLAGAQREIPRAHAEERQRPESSWCLQCRDLRPELPAPLVIITPADATPQGCGFHGIHFKALSVLD
jgi:hypothetical protein